MTDLLSIVNGWLLLEDPCFAEQREKLEVQVLALRAKSPDTYKSSNPAKRLNALYRLIFKWIPANPGDENYRLGHALGKENKHWFRAKFFQQYRLFFRYDTGAKIIIYGWVNDDTTLRTYESKSDAYLVFKKMLTKGRPPTDWVKLLERSRPIKRSSAS